MKQKTYRFLNRLVDKITSKDCPNNDYFEYYGHKVTLQSGTHDFVDVTISDMDNRNQITFSFDFWTKELCFDGYNNYDERDSIVKAFRSIYRNISITEEDAENFEKGYFPFLGGGTDAQKMLNLTFYLLDNGEDRYMNADVLWITDFLIPRTTEDLMKRFKDYQATGTKFYGFKIGQGESNWDKYFDKIYEVHYKQPRRY